ncbi:MAG: transcriptional regulator [Elusimicrobiota bacterium]|jgi:probable addiction module antidote protein
MSPASYEEDLYKDLRNPVFALKYLNACLKDGDRGVFLLALRNVAEAHGGIGRLAKKSGLNREHLWRMLSKRGNPRLENLVQLANVFGWRLALIGKETSPLRKAA